MMKRRDFISLLGGVAVAWPLAAYAQQGELMRRIGVLTPFASDDPAEQTNVLAFEQALAQLGWIDGRNARIDIHWGAGDPERIRRYAAELVALAPGVILAVSSAATGPLLQATRTDPTRQLFRSRRRPFRRECIPFRQRLVSAKVQESGSPMERRIMRCTTRRRRTLPKPFWCTVQAAAWVSQRYKSRAVWVS